MCSLTLLSCDQMIQLWISYSEEKQQKFQTWETMWRLNCIDFINIVMGNKVELVAEVHGRMVMVISGGFEDSILNISIDILCYRRISEFQKVRDFMI